MPLTSTKNPLLQEIRRAAAAGRPTPEGLIVAEGPHLVEEALRSPWDVEQVFVTPPARDVFAAILTRVAPKIVEVSPPAFASITATETSQEILALLRPKNWTWHDLIPPAALLVVLDSIQDPGNAGTIVRSAEAFGATGAVLLKGSAHLANGKFLRAAAGSAFRLPVIEGWSPEEFLHHAGQDGLALCGLSQRAATDLAEADFRPASALIVGSEARGISPQLARDVLQISIRTANVESLNAAIACSIALFEARRQRVSHEPV
jgi:RNA methyltransferase, TrmH family